MNKLKPLNRMFCKTKKGTLQHVIKYRGKQNKESLVEPVFFLSHLKRIVTNHQENQNQSLEYYHHHPHNHHCYRF